MVEISTNMPMSQFYDVASAVSQGARDYQEDTLIASFPLGQRSGFLIVADGMGGHAAGDVASTLVATEFFATICADRDVLDRDTIRITAVLRSAAQQANEKVAAHVAENPAHDGMGTTVLAVVFSEGDLSWLSVGDSPLLLFRDGSLSMLNKDHSLGAQIDKMVRDGIMDAKTGANHPDRNMLTSVIAGDDITQIDCPDSPKALKIDDIVIAASDGIQSLSNDEIAKIVLLHQQNSAAQIADALLSGVLSLKKPYQDNVSFSVVKVGHHVRTDAT